MEKCGFDGCVEGRRCERYRVRLRHGARRLRGVLDALVDPNVEALLEELASRPQVAAMPALVALRAAVRLPGLGVAAVGAELLLVEDGWPLEAEERAA